MTNDQKSKWWGFGAGKLSYAARDACVRRGFIEAHRRGQLDQYEITEAGRAALASQETSDGR